MPLGRLNKSISRLRGEVDAHKAFIAQAEGHFNSGLKSEKQFKNIVNNRKQKIENALYAIEDCKFQMIYLKDCEIYGVTEDMLNFKDGSLIQFIRGNKAFWNHALPNVSKIVNDINAKSQALQFEHLIMNKRYAPLIGFSVDLLMGFMLGDPLLDNLLIASSDKHSKRLGKFIFELFYRLRPYLDFSQKPSQWEHATLIVDCIICLAKAEQAYRNQGLLYKPDIDNTRKLNPITDDLDTISFEMNQVASSPIAPEVLILGDAIFDTLPKYDTSNYSLNFGSYGPMFKADADVLLNNVLYDLKCYSPTTRYTDETVFQLIGYFIMSKLTRFDFNIESVGIINPRNRFRIEYDIEILIQELAGKSACELIEMFRVCFRSRQKFYDNIELENNANSARIFKRKTIIN